MEVVRHGDLIITKLGQKPIGVRKKKGKILAYGKFSGHSHQVIGSVQLYEPEQGSEVGVIFETPEVITITHQEHKEITLDPGVYKVEFQRQYDPFTKNISRVID